MPKKYEPEFKARAVRLVRDHMSDYGSVTAASVAVGGQLGVARETLRRWVVSMTTPFGPTRPAGHLHAQPRRARKGGIVASAHSL